MPQSARANAGSSRSVLQRGGRSHRGPRIVEEQVPDSQGGVSPHRAVRVARHPNAQLAEAGACAPFGAQALEGTLWLLEPVQEGQALGLQTFAGVGDALGQGAAIFGDEPDVWSVCRLASAVGTKDGLADGLAERGAERELVVLRSILVWSQTAVEDTDVAGE